MKVARFILKYLTFLLLTILLIDDYFPDAFPFLNISFSQWIVLAIIFAIFAFIDKKGSQKLELKERLFINVYLFGLIGILTLLGGDSSNALSYSNPVLWIILVIEVFGIRKEWKKKLKDENVDA